ncbi:FtsK/SpoIIIE domain-containing protein [Microbacterium sp. SLBN-146]|uniref:FtsK/SpoIIIE domain-containing protein n=1 Tax=Microbacterium sp. SLBN-146 TaxID=2768457 RepID=UPI001152BE63|nr:FtsK/SpoIIIE domain-containing protein [Microbacterium sp. SLBN-146]TQJ30696.1 S-DNA-T family DNA segregation ATPase FtsK/SpoIIIE [Microbacterium sp. SLBN-146]
MKLRLVLVEGAFDDAVLRDVVVNADPDATLGEVAAALAGDDDHPMTLAVVHDDDELALPASQRLGDDMLAQGSRVRLVPAAESAAHRRVGSLTLVRGSWNAPGRELPLVEGLTTIGTDEANDIVLQDASAAPRHARLFAGGTIELFDLDSGIPTEVDGDRVERVAVHGTATVTFGETEILVRDQRVSGAQRTGPREIVRPPRLVPRFVPRRFAPPTDDDELLSVAAEIERRAGEQRTAALAEWPAPDTIAQEVLAGQPLLWTRRPQHSSFAGVRVGVADGAREDELLPAVSTDPRAQAWNDLDERTARVEGLPASIALPEVGSVGIIGAEQQVGPVVNAMVMQLAALHAPDDLAVAAIVRKHQSAELDWLKWLPHAWNEGGWLGDAPRLVTARAAADALLAAIESAEVREGRMVVLIVSADAPVDRSRLLRLAEHGAARGIHIIWTVDEWNRVPGACGAAIRTEPETLSLVSDGYERPLRLDRVSGAEARRVALELAGTRDAASERAAVPPPESIDLVGMVGRAAASSPHAIAGRWDAAGARGSAGTRGFRAIVGSTGSRPLQIDLRNAVTIIGGASGSGRSELVRSWVLSLALSYGPDQLSILLIDPFGGAARGLERLPHVINNIVFPDAVTLTRVEKILRLQLPAHGEHGPEWLSWVSRSRKRLLVVVQNADALEDALPGSLEKLTDLATRGMHLVVETQRPTALPESVLRAARVRIALRTNDEDESRLLIGSDDAALIDVRRPGRAIVASAGQREEFQVASVGGSVLADGAVVSAVAAGLGFGEEIPLHPDAEEENDEATVIRSSTDADEIVASIVRAAELVPGAIPIYRLPSELEERYGVLRLSTRDDRALAIGVVDDLASCRLSPATFRPDEHGHIVVYGPQGTGKTTVLHTLAVAAGLTPDGVPVEVYGIGESLRPLDGLAHVGAIVGMDDRYRVLRLLRMLVSRIRDRQAQLRALQHTFAESRRPGLMSAPLARILLLVDVADPMKELIFEKGDIPDLWRRILAEGRAVGIHVAISWEGPSPHPDLRRHIPSVLRLGSAAYDGGEMIPSRLREPIPVGRGSWEGSLVQVATLGGDMGLGATTAMHRLAQRQRELGANEAAAVPELPDPLSPDLLPEEVDGRPVLGLSVIEVEPVGFSAHGILPVLGPTARDRAECLAALALALRRAGDERERVLVTGPRGLLDAHRHLFAEVTSSADRVKELLDPSQPSRPVVFVEQAALTRPVDSAFDAVMAAREREGDALDDEQFVVITPSRLSSVSWMGAVREQQRALFIRPERFDTETALGVTVPAVLQQAPMRGYWIDGETAVVVQLPVLPETDKPTFVADAATIGLGHTAVRDELDERSVASLDVPPPPPPPPAGPVAPSTGVAPGGTDREAWLVGLIDERFADYDATPTSRVLDELYVLIGALKVAGLEDAYEAMRRRLSVVVKRNADSATTE